MSSPRVASCSLTSLCPRPEPGSRRPESPPLEDEWRANQTAWKTVDDLGLDPEAHRGESCHTVVVKTRYDGTVVEIPAGSEPRRHRGLKPDSELVVTPSEPVRSRPDSDG